ncbi:MAG: hypothetical protein COY40_04420 [Alphaproteobacteria bacterium CG_4_10_14_0_8_um_filter_53_9]|nr:MAG: hypothetical protein COY40_04420 [Alphaproteobacteria bacterium CG_4_10_14_0_8_um_filter_53_9]
MSEPIKPDNKTDVTVVTEKRVVCDGPAHSAHPRVYLTMIDDKMGLPHHVVCPYCSRVYIYNMSLLCAHSEDH